MSKKTDKDRKFQIDCCLDEIDICMDALEKKVSNKRRTLLEGWIRTQKIALKELKYKGKMRRRKRQ